jgi:hypothetical protein
MTDSTKDIAKRVAAAHNRKQVQAAIGQGQARPSKTAASDRNFFSMVDKDGWKAIRRSLAKEGDTASVKLWDEAARLIAKQLEMPSKYDVALTRMMNLIDRGPRNAEMTRNQVFKIADLLGIKLPHGIFASTDKQAKHRAGLPPYGSWNKFWRHTWQLAARDMREMTADEDIKHAIHELRGYAAYDGLSARQNKAAIAALIDAQNLLQKKMKMRGEFDKEWQKVKAALKDYGQL